MAVSGLRHPGFRAIRLMLGAAGPAMTERLVLIAIANHCDWASCSWPSEQRLAAETGLGTRTVRKAVRGLEARGLLKVTRRGRQLVNEYRIDLGALESLPRVQVTGTTVQSDRHHRPGDRHHVPLTQGNQRERPASDDRVTGTTCRSYTATAETTTAKEGEEEGAPPSSSSPRHRIEFDFETRRFVGILREDMTAWAAAFPAVDVQAELPKAALHRADHPELSDDSAFLRNWLRNAAEGPPWRRGLNGATRPAPPKPSDWQGRTASVRQL